MGRMLLHWLLSGLAVLIVAHLVPGFYVNGYGAALIAALVIGFMNATLGLFLKIITIPWTIMTLGLVWFMINALMIEFASVLVTGLYVENFSSAFFGGIVLTLVNLAMKALLMTEEAI